TRADGSLAVWAGSIAVHMFDVAFLDRMSREKTALPAHIARKKVSHVDPVTGERVSPESPNAIKFEQFIFDLLPSAANAVVVEVDIPNHYAPLKNASGSASDSPESVRADLVALHTSWLQAAGCTILEGMPVEISPLFALDRAETVEKVAPQTIDRPTYWQ
ncbi:MAG TPA: UDP-N-acetylglucosamine pyrophosphorylase, partial [Planctomycetaceae bacterium]|nr:UDP-N-acetylglucosamine pyrophosphorylase [Planctomycetaceae bacterium]